MPARSKAPCSYPGCGELVIGSGKCEKHEAQIKREYDSKRKNATDRGYDSRWRKARRQYLMRSPLCVECLGKDRTAAATVVDHIVDHKGDQGLFWDESNWRALCKSCHDAKTISMYGFGGSER